MIKTPKDKLILHITDVHNGVKAVTSKEITQGFEETIFDSPALKRVDALVLTGDYYDMALCHNSDDAFDTTLQIEKILRWCADNDIVCMVLKGTPSHDAKQARWFEEINRLSNINAKLYYFSELGIHYIPELDLTVLAVPDEIAKPRVKADAMIKALMEEKGIKQVDIALTHAYFDAHLPNHEAEQGHSLAFFNTIVKWVVFNGHIHTPSLIGKVQTGGSWGRYRHGEEEPKGAHLTTLKPNGTFESKFIKNRVLIDFKTVDVKGLNEDAVITKVKKVVDKWERGYCRLHYNRRDVAANLLGYFVEHYPHINFSTKVEELELVKLGKDEDLETKISGVSVNKDNIGSLSEEYIKRYCDDPIKLQRVLNTFNELIS